MYFVLGIKKFVLQIERVITLIMKNPMKINPIAHTGLI